MSSNQPSSDDTPTTSNHDDGDADTPPCTCKIGAGINTYTQRGFHDEITRLYETDDVSLRDLEHRINKEFVTGAIRHTAATDWGVGSFDATPSEIVTALHDDSLPPSEQNRIVTRLEQAGIDSEELSKSLISYRTVKNHLNNCVDIDTSKNTEITRTDARNTVGWARTKCERVISRTVERLSRTGMSTISDDFDVTVTPRVTCNKCGDSMPISEFISSDGCSCPTGDK